MDGLSTAQLTASADVEPGDLVFQGQRKSGVGRASKVEHSM